MELNIQIDIILLVAFFSLLLFEKNKLAGRKTEFLFELEITWVYRSGNGIFCHIDFE